MERNDVIDALEQFHHRILSTKLAEKITEQEMLAVLNAIALIRELTEENEGLRLDVEVCGAELSRYTENVAKMVEETKADTVKRMRDQLKDKAQILYNGVGVSFLAVDVSDVDRIARELLGGG